MEMHFLIVFYVVLSLSLSSWSQKTTTPQKCHRRMNCICGPKKVTNTRIVSGQEAVPHSNPWIASLQLLDGTVFCGGALINDRYVLTAAHCLTRVTNESFRIILGHHDIKKLREATVFHTDKFIMHPKYEDLDPYQKFDIALIRLRQKVTFSDSIYPICLPGREFPTKDYPVLVVAGFGKLKENGVVSDRLLEAEVPEVNNTECVRLLSSIRITPAHICAGNSTHDTCQGDSGGPLMTSDGHSWYLAGVVSWGVACAHRIYPGVFTRIWSYADWISNNTLDAKYCNNKKRYTIRDYVPCPFRA